MNPSRWHPSHMDNTDTLYLGNQHCIVRNSVGFSFLFVFPSVPICQFLLNINGSVIYVGTGFPSWYIPNPGVPSSKPLGGSKVDSVFRPSEVDQVSARNIRKLSGKK